MAQDRERYVSGPRELLEVPIAAGTVIHKGDFVYFDGGYAVGGSDLGDAGDATANRENGADLFLGIAETAHRSTDPAGKITVDVSCGAIFQGELQTAASLSFGTALEPWSDGTAPSAYQLVAGTTSKIAVAVEGITSGTDIKVKLLPQARLHRANPQT